MNTFGVVAAGAVLVLLNQRKSWDELSYELGLVEPDAILTDGDDYGFNDQLKAAYGDILRPIDGFRSYEPAQLTHCTDHNANDAADEDPDQHTESNLDSACKQQCIQYIYFQEER